MTNISIYQAGRNIKGPTTDAIPLEYSPTGYTELLATLSGHLAGIDNSLQTKLNTAQVRVLLEGILTVFGWKNNCSSDVQYIRQFSDKDPCTDTIDYIKSSPPTGNAAVVGEKCLDTVAKMLYTCEDVEGTPTWDAGVVLEIGVAFIGTGTDESGDSGTFTPNNYLYYPTLEVVPSAFDRVTIESVDSWYTPAGAWETLVSTAPQGNTATVGERCFDTYTFKVHTCIDNEGTPEWDGGTEIPVEDGVIFLESGDDTSGESGVYDKNDYLYYRKESGLLEDSPSINDVVPVTTLGSYYRYTGVAWTEFFVIPPNELTADELAGIQAANSLSAENPAATMADVLSLSDSVTLRLLGV